MQIIYRVTDVRAFEKYGHALKILGAEKPGDKISYQDLPIFDILCKNGWIEKVQGG